MDVWVVTGSVFSRDEVRGVFTSEAVARAFLDAGGGEDVEQVLLNDPKIISSLTFT